MPMSNSIKNVKSRDSCQFVRKHKDLGGSPRRGWVSRARNSFDPTKHQEVRSPFGGARMVVDGRARDGDGTRAIGKICQGRGTKNKSRTILDELRVLARAGPSGAMKMGHPHWKS